MKNDQAKNVIQSFFLTTYMPVTIPYYSYFFKGEGERAKPITLFSKIIAWEQQYNPSSKDDPWQVNTRVQLNSCTLFWRWTETDKIHFVLF